MDWLIWAALYVACAWLTAYFLAIIDDTTTSAVWGRKGRVHRAELALAATFWPISGPVLFFAYRRHYRRRDRGAP